MRYPPRKYLDICYAETEICVNNPCLTLVTELQCGAGNLDVGSDLPGELLPCVPTKEVAQLEGCLHGSLQTGPVHCHVVLKQTGSLSNIHWAVTCHYRHEQLLVLLDVGGADYAEDVAEPRVVTLHVEDVPLRVVVDEMS